ncbi:hypothetical protein F5J12DRAFT_782397 [Pisolithus orientalis]|uniref:uncharacterized protein n=1 Tax=Pisolithus orientalis TaxID=936130 RepID=UPI002224EDF4|nr:uncharacterized protein F5J12DRAFT_782397 [Pisolithus orientalis]KAI6008163.1 hypothetical protein F5J12DRAFT_782397 [Pisolithus orientalis]
MKLLRRCGSQVFLGGGPSDDFSPDLKTTVKKQFHVRDAEKRRERCYDGEEMEGFLLECFGHNTPLLDLIPDISKAYSAHSESEVLGQQIRVEHCSWIPGPKWDDRLGHAVLKLFYPEHAVGCTWVDHPEINLSPESQTRSMSRLYYHPIGDSPVGRTAVCSTSHWYLRSFKPKAISISQNIVLTRPKWWGVERLGERKTAEKSRTRIGSTEGPLQVFLRLVSPKQTEDSTEDNHSLPTVPTATLG